MCSCWTHSQDVFMLIPLWSVDSTLHFCQTSVLKTARCAKTLISILCFSYLLLLHDSEKVTDCSKMVHVCKCFLISYQKDDARTVVQFRHMISFVVKINSSWQCCRRWVTKCGITHFTHFTHKSPHFTSHAAERCSKEYGSLKVKAYLT